MADFTELNPRFLMWLVIALVLCGVFLVTLLPVQPSTNTTANDTVYITKYVTVEIPITPTPDGITIFPNEYQAGLRKLNRPFSWIRNNVSGYQDMRVSAVVYNAMLFEKIHYFNPVDYKYYEFYPSSSNNQFLFVFFNIYLDNEAGEDTRLWLPSQNMFNVKTPTSTASPLTYKEQIRFKELENVYNYNDDSRVKAYGQYRSYTRVMNNDTVSNAGEISVKEYYLKGGKSNAQDGYILFEVPKGLSLRDLNFYASFYNFGWSAWKLTG